MGSHGSVRKKEEELSDEKVEETRKRSTALDLKVHGLLSPTSGPDTRLVDACVWRESLNVVEGST